MCHLKRLFALLIGLHLLALPAAAGMRTDSLEIEPYAGFFLGGSFDDDEIALFNSDTTLDDAPIVGLRLGYNFSPHFQLMGTVARTSTSFLASRGSGLFGDEEALADVDITFYQADMVLHLSETRVVPYVDLGMGIASFDVDLPGVSDDERVTFQYGGGLKFSANPRVAIRGEARGIAVSTDDWSEDDDDEWVLNGEFTVGLSFFVF